MNNTLTVHPATSLSGWVRMPGDKSISHRALLLSALADGDSEIEGFLPAGDCLATINCLRALGVVIEERSETSLCVHGRGRHGLRAPEHPLHCARSGTTMRLLCGILAGQPFTSVLTGDPQLLRRPMERVAHPLRLMGAQVKTTDGHAPLTVRGGHLHGIEYALPVASAQVKSAVLLAALYADTPTVIHEPGPARDHTERMLQAQLGGQNDVRAPICYAEGTIVIRPERITRLAPFNLTIPGDFSSAAFILAAGALLADSEITIARVGINPTRTGLLDVLRSMGAQIETANEQMAGSEPVADLTTRAAPLRGAIVSGDLVVRMIDEFPILAVIATQARGKTFVRDATELRVKETDRIATIVDGLRKLGARIEPRPDGFVVLGPTPLHGGVVDCHGDHRLAMALAVAGLVADGPVAVQNAACIADSFPKFVETLAALGASLEWEDD